MEIAAFEWSETRGWTWPPHPGAGREPHLVLFFASPLQESPELLGAAIGARYSEAVVAGCSGFQEIAGQKLTRGALKGVTVRFDHAESRAAMVATDFAGEDDCLDAGRRLATALPGADLRAVFLLGPGQGVHVDRLLEGLRRHLPVGTPVSGGLASAPPELGGAGWVWARGRARVSRLIAIGFYGPALRLGFGCQGGWVPFGPERRVTKSRGNNLLALDHQPALELYRKYLAEDAEGLPATAQFFPLLVRPAGGGEEPVVRTVLDIDFAGNGVITGSDIPEGSLVQLMRTHFDRLIDGAAGAGAKASKGMADLRGGQLCLMVSCYGRQMVLGQRTVEEVEAAHEFLPPQTVTLGFYSSGEISPTSADDWFHNQTMTLTLLGEAG